VKNICVSMPLTEKVLDSYLLRIFTGSLLEKKTCKVIFFPEENLLHKTEWTIKKFKNFCNAVIATKTGLRMYKANVSKRQQVEVWE
jgi:hypothetical protein